MPPPAIALPTFLIAQQNIDDKHAQLGGDAGFPAGPVEDMKECPDANRLRDNRRCQIEERGRARAMHRTVLITVFAAVLCLGVTAQPLFARTVMHGTFDICETVDHGTVTIVDGMELCCAQEVGMDDAPLGRYYCVACNPPGSNNCAISIPAGIRVTGQQMIHNDLIRGLTVLVESLQTKIDQGLCTAPVK